MKGKSSACPIFSGLIAADADGTRAGWGIIAGRNFLMHGRRPRRPPRNDRASRPIMSSYVTGPFHAEEPDVALFTRPCRSFRQYAHNRDCTVSTMTVRPGARLSFQSYTGRAELWIVLKDDALVQLGDTGRCCTADDELWIPANENRRPADPTDSLPVRRLEVASATGTKPTSRATRTTSITQFRENAPAMFRSNRRPSV